MIPLHLLLQAAEERITASGLVLEYTGFLGYFGVFGALGFFWFVLRRTARRHPLLVSGDTAAAESVHRAESGAATIGILGSLFMLANLIMGVAERAAAKGTPFLDALSAGGGRTTAPFIFALLFLAVFAFAKRQVRAAWILAAVLGIAFALRNGTSGKWASLVNPLHEVAAGLWIGSLFVVVFVGLPSILRSSATTEQRGSLVADVIGNFSSLAIGAVTLLLITGITTAWRHLKFVAALWTTSYGYALDLKLVFVALVALLGAWNWRRMRPQLGTEAAAHNLRGSAKKELFFAAIVLVITGVLVSLPGPKLPHP